MIMQKRNIQISEFGIWLIQERYNIFLVLFAAVLPLILGMDIDVLRPAENTQDNSLGWIYKQIYRNGTDVANIILILTTLICLAQSILLLEKNDDKKVALHNYVRMQFGENSTLAKNTPNDLYNRISKGIEQFYFSWLAVWSVWLLLYVAVFIFNVYKDNLFNGVDIYMSGFTFFRVECLIENTLNLVNSLILLFIYLVITVSTVNIGSLANNSRRLMHIGVCIFILVATGCLLTDLFSLSDIIKADMYDDIQFFLRIIIGLIATISLMAVLGRLNTNFLNIPQWMMMALYLYAGIQMFYPITYNPYYTSKDELGCQINKGEVFIDFSDRTGSCACFNKNDVSNQKINIKYKSKILKKVDNSVNVERCSHMAKVSDSKSVGNSVNVKINAKINPKLIEPIQNMYAFIGKGFLVLVLFWINRKNRFLFFLIHKANTLSDSEVMLRIFNKYYEGCPDKQNHGY